MPNIVEYNRSHLVTAILIILAAAILGEDCKNAWAIARRDHAKTPSRNHGWHMAAIAGAFRVQLEKPDQYILGEQTEPLIPSKILLALKIRNLAITLCVLFVLPIILLTRLYLSPY
jgi:adenosylcobinamide-phosphate synthase